jgi:hypothetical protein
MNDQRAIAILEAQTAIAQKVYTHVPVDEPAAVSKIHNACLAAGMSNPHNITYGCLKALAEAGLIKMTSRARYVRKVNVPGTATLAALAGGPDTPKLGDIMRQQLHGTKAAQPIPPKQEMDGVVSAEQAARIAVKTLGLPKPDPLSKLAAIADQLISAATAHSNTIKAIAAQLEDVAMEIETERESNGAQAAKLKQLHSLLKSLED